MSTKTSIKRIALVAVSALGFGLLSVMPAKAAVSDLVLTKSATATDASLFVVDGTASATKATALAAPTKLYTVNSSIALNDLDFDTTGAPANATAKTFMVLSDSSGTITEGTSDADVRKSAARSAAISPTALGTHTATTVGASAPTSFTASTSGTWYAIYEADDGADYASTDFIMFVVVYQTVSTSSISSLQLTSSVVGVNGQAGTWRVRYNTPNTTDTVNPKARITSVPAGSKILNTNPLNSYYPVNNSTPTDIGAANVALVNGSAAYRVAAATALAAVAANSSKVADTWFSMWPDVAGSYVVTFFDDRNDDGVVNGNDISTSVTFTVGSAATTAAITNLGGDAPTTATNPGGSNEYGALFKITLADAAGVATLPNNAESLTVTASGSGRFSFKNGSAIASTSTVNLSAADFNGDGEAFLNLSDATAETVTVSVSGNGSLSSISASANATFRAAVVSGAVPAVISTQLTGYSGTATPYSVPTSGSTITWVATGTTTTATVTYYQALLITDTDASILGTAPTSGTLAWEKIAANNDATTTATAGRASWSITTAATTTVGELYNVVGQTTINTSATAQVVNGAAPALTSGDIAWTPSTIRSALLAANTFTVTVKNQFGTAVAGASVTFSRAGRNPSTVNTVVVTDSLGKATYTTTDAAASTVSTMTDTITAAASYTLAGTTTTLTETATITYASGAAVSTLTMVCPDDLSTIAGTVFTNISAAAAGATGSSATCEITAKDASASPIAGVLVTFAVSGLTGAEVHTTLASGYTDASGKVSSSVSSYAAGKATLTATSGAVTTSGSIYFAQGVGDTSEVRTISVAAEGGSVKATVKDRYGNVMEGIRVYATRTGTGFFGNGAASSDALTDKNGVAEFIFSGSGTVSVAFLAADTGQSASAAGEVGTTTVTASAAGTATANQTGLGAALAPVGVNSASVAVTAIDAGVTAAEAATDAAAEAIDAANAATDAANLAAEAADAATVAAEEARDAADAATAAVEELATQVATLMAALKAQITTLANTVAKIAKKVKA